MRPPGLTAVCIIALCLGVMGAMGIVVGIGGLVLQPAIQKWSTDLQKSLPGAQTPQGQKQAELQQNMMKELEPLTRRWLIPSLIGSAICLVAVVCLITGSIKGLNLRPMAHKWLIIGMSAGILHALVGGYVGHAVQRETQILTMRYMDQTLQSGPAAKAPGAKALMNSTMQLTMVIGMVMTFGWGLVKCIFYAFGIWYLLTPMIRRLLEGDGSERAVIDALSATPT
jgi:hypothetical protein